MSIKELTFITKNNTWICKLNDSNYNDCIECLTITAPIGTIVSLHCGTIINRWNITKTPEIVLPFKDGNLPVCIVHYDDVFLKANNSLKVKVLIKTLPNITFYSQDGNPQYRYNNSGEKVVFSNGFVGIEENKKSCLCV